MLVRRVNWKIFFVNLLTVSIPLYFIVSAADKIHNTTLQTFFIITSLSFLGLLNFMIVKKGTKVVEIILTEEKIEIKDKEKIIYSSEFSKILNYNAYNFISKKGGYVIRFKNSDGGFCSLFTWIDFKKVNESDLKNKEIIIKTLSDNLLNRKKTVLIDLIIKFFSILPYLFLVIAFGLLILMFIYFFSI